MKTILATWELGTANGHVAHVAPLARALRRRGVATIFAARDVVTAAEVPDRPFAALYQAPVLMRGVPRIPTLTYAQVVADGGLGDVDQATALVAAWLMLFDAVRPDAMVAEFAPVSLLAAHVAGIATARLGYGWAQPKAVRPFASLMPWLADDPAARVAGGLVADAVVAEVCRRFAAPHLDGLPELLAKSPRYMTTWPDLDHGEVEPGTKYYGSMSGLAATPRHDWPAGEGPRIFVYMPFTHAARPALVEAVGGLGWPAIWYGAGPVPELPANILAAPGPVDATHVLGEAAIFAGRGGHATCCDAMRAGCPTLVLPDTLETTLTGWRLERRKLGRMLDGEPSAASIRATLETIVADCSGVAAAQARYSGYDPVEAEDQLAADLCGQFGF